MSLLVAQELDGVIYNGNITAPLNHVNPASIEVTLGCNFYVEVFDPWIIDANTKASELFTNLKNKQNIKLRKVTLEEGQSLVLKPGQFVLAETQEQFNLPKDIVSEYVLKSSMARNGLNHLLAGYCDPGCHNSLLTMEFHNVSQGGYLMLTPGMKAGQMKFYRVTEVAEGRCYAVTGQYNNQDEVMASKGMR